MAKGHFLVGSDGGERLSPAQYGYWLVKWSHDNAIESLEELKSKTFARSPLARAINAANFWAYIQLLAIFIATYWFYASEYLHVVEDQSEMKIGLDDAIKELRLSNGERYSGFQEKYLRGSISAYVNANYEDIVASQKDDPSIFKPDASVLSRKFFELIGPPYPNIKSLTAADQLLIGHFVADLPVYLCKALREEIRISYVL